MRESVNERERVDERERKRERKRVDERERKREREKRGRDRGMTSRNIWERGSWIILIYKFLTCKS